MKTLIVTTGDPDGIGLEVSLKALANLPMPQRSRIVVILEKKSCLSILFKNSVLKNSPQLKSLTDILEQPAGLYLLPSERPAPFWVLDAAALCLKHPLDIALVTGPLSKTLIYESGLNGIGHTDLLAQVSGVSKDRLWMYFWGHHFHVMLLTGHVPLNKVESLLTLDRIKDAIFDIHSWYGRFNLNSSKPLALLGLNPHAGDSGIIGDFELRQNFKNLLLSMPLPIQGPLVPDAAFLRANWSQYRGYLACYHDQGLIPFKLAHGHRGVHVTLGLPFIRTSVDHGTAKDIFGQGIADPSSMKDALRLALKLLRDQLQS